MIMIYRSLKTARDAIFNMKEAGGLKASSMSIWLGLAFFSFFNNQ